MYSYATNVMSISTSVSAAAAISVIKTTLLFIKVPPTNAFGPDWKAFFVLKDLSTTPPLQFVIPYGENLLSVTLKLFWIYFLNGTWIRKKVFLPGQNSQCVTELKV